MNFQLDSFLQKYELFPTYGENKNLNEFTQNELDAFTQSFIDLESERFSIVYSALNGELPFETRKQRIVTLAELVDRSRNTDSKDPSAETLSLCYDFACAVRSSLHGIDPEIEWRYQLRSPRALSYAKPVLARKKFSGSGFIDARVTAYGTANNAIKHHQNIKEKVLDTLKRQIQSQFGIDVDFDE